MSENPRAPLWQFTRRLNLYFYEQYTFLINAYKNYYCKKDERRERLVVYLFLFLIGLKIGARE